MKVEFFEHGLTEEDIQEACAVMRSIFLTTGPSTQRFEESFSAYTGLPYVVGLNSCTAALHLALLACGIGPGDEVITCPMTFIASATAIHHAGASHIFVDCEPDTGLIDCDKIEAAITDRTRAILPIHLYGAMADMRRLREIADRHQLYLIEDAAHCIEGERDGVRPGELGDAVCYSFYATKNLTCGEGGALATRHEKIAKAVRTLRTHGMSKDAADRYTDVYRHWDMEMLGWKYNPSDILSGLLVHQIERLPERWQQRSTLWAEYTAMLASCEELELPASPGKSAYHLFTVWVDEQRRDEILGRLQQAGIGVAVNYRAIHTLSWFRQQFCYTPEMFPHARRIGSRTITLPFYPGLKAEQIRYVCSALSSILADAQPRSAASRSCTS